MVEDKIYLCRLSSGLGSYWTMSEKQVYEGIKDGDTIWEIDLEEIGRKVKKVTLTTEEPKSGCEIET